MIFESKMALNESTGNTASILAPVKVTVERLRCMMILSNDTKHAYIIIPNIDDTNA